MLKPIKYLQYTTEDIESMKKELETMNASNSKLKGKYNEEFSKQLSLCVRKWYRVYNHRSLKQLRNAISIKLDEVSVCICLYW